MNYLYFFMKHFTFLYYKSKVTYYIFPILWHCDFYDRWPFLQCPVKINKHLTGKFQPVSLNRYLTEHYKNYPNFILLNIKLCFYF